MTIGRYSSTAVSVVYVDGIAEKRVVDEITKRLSAIDIDGVIDSSYLSSFIQGRRFSFFNQVGTTEKPDVFIRKYVFFADKKPDVEKMKKAADILVGKHDFRGFSSLGRIKKSTVRTINFIEIEECGELIKIRINADGFLYNMVRIIAGTLYDIGTGKLDQSIIEYIFSEKIRMKAGVTLPSLGLKLIKVYY
jgi:tRNA pseudouridine38-40 synthase